MRGTEKKREKLKASRHFIDEQKDVSITVDQGLIYCFSQAKLQKEPKSKAITGDKMGRKPKRGTKVNKSNGQQEGTVMNIGMR